MKRMVWRGALLLALLPRLVGAQATDDATRRAARSLGVSGVDAFEAGDYAKASEKLDKAYRVLQAPSLGLWSARAFAKTNRLIEAAERYQEVMRLEVSGGDQAVQRQAKLDAATELAQLSPQIPNIVVQVKGVEPADVQLTVDGAPMVSALIGENRPVNPGKHVVEATSNGRVVRQEVDVLLGATKTVLLELPAGAPAAAVAPTAPQRQADTAPPSSQPGSSRRTLGFVAIGVGGAGLALGTLGAFIAKGKKDTLDESDDCRSDQCLMSQKPTVDAYSTWRVVSGAGFIGGAVLAAAGVALVLSAPKQPEQVTLHVAPGAISLSRSF